MLVVAIAGLVALGTLLSPFFLTPGNFSNLIAALMEVAIMALPMTLIIVAGEIDLSVESMAGLSSSLLGFLWAAGMLPWGMLLTGALVASLVELLPIPLDDNLGIILFAALVPTFLIASGMGSRPEEEIVPTTRDVS